MSLKNLLIILISLVACSCHKAALSPSAYVHWMENEDNGLCVGKSIGDYQYKLLYKSPEYIALLEGKDRLTPEQLETRKLQLGDMQYYTFQIRHNKEAELMKAGIASENEYYERLEYFTSYMQDDLSLVVGNDTLPCLLFHYERNYGISPWNSFLIGFENSKHPNPSGIRQLIYDDKALGTGRVMMSIKESDIQSAPQLKL